MTLRVGVIRLEADDFLELADCLIRMALVEKDDAEAVVGKGKIRFESDGQPRAEKFQLRQTISVRWKSGHPGEFRRCAVEWWRVVFRHSISLTL